MASLTSPDDGAWLDQAVHDERVRARYQALVHVSDGCWYWTGAISGRGHGRFWIGDGRVIIAHRFAYALTHGAAALRAAPVIAHACDNPLCQRIGDQHARASTTAANAAEYAARHDAWYGPLADPDGSAARARSIRDGLRAGRPLPDVLAAAGSVLERDQLALW